MLSLTAQTKYRFGSQNSLKTQLKNKRVILQRCPLPSSAGRLLVAATVRRQFLLTFSFKSSNFFFLSVIHGFGWLPNRMRAPGTEQNRTRGVKWGQHRKMGKPERPHQVTSDDPSLGVRAPKNILISGDTRISCFRKNWSIWGSVRFTEVLVVYMEFGMSDFTLVFSLV